MNLSTENEVNRGKEGKVVVVVIIIIINREEGLKLLLEKMKNSTQ